MAKLSFCKQDAIKSWKILFNSTNSVFGGVAGDATVTRISHDEFWIVSSGISERYQKRFYNSVQLPENTSFRSRTDEICGFNVAGPKSREMLQRLSNQNLSNNNQISWI